MSDGKPHWLRSGKYVLTTEAHPLRIAVEEFQQIMGHVIRDEKRDKTHRTKCARQSPMLIQLICGYGMAGTDYPEFDIDSLVPEPLSADVEVQVQSVIQSYGVGAVRVGSVFAGATSAYRAVKIEHRQVYFTKLAGDERDIWLRRNLTCPQPILKDVLRRKCSFIDNGRRV